MITESHTLAQILGPWNDAEFDSGLVERCKKAWSKPLKSLTNLELATCLRQKIALEHIIPVAKERMKNRKDDDTEYYTGQLAEALADAEKYGA